MYDLPSAQALLDAARTHLEEHVIPAIKHDRVLYFRTLVAINVLRIVERESDLREHHLRTEWDALNKLFNLETAMPSEHLAAQNAITERHQTLCTLIQRGDFDGSAPQQHLRTYLLDHVVAQLHVANPRFLQHLAAEDGEPASSENATDAPTTP